MNVKTQDRTAEIFIEAIKKERATVWILGESPMIFNSMSMKSKGTLLNPSGRKTAAEKAQNSKHNPIEEYRNSCYRRRQSETKTSPTRIIFPASAFKSAMMNAAIEVQGAKKTQIGRLVWVEGDYVDVYGIPQMLMSVVRSADMNKTPDIRTRAILRNWACKLSITYARPTLTNVAITRLLETAGMVIGVGDFRQEKGKGNYGQFRICDEKDVKALVAAGGIKQQDAALENPECYDAETEELYSWFKEERISRGK